VRLKKWHGSGTDYGRKWRSGDVVGCAATRAADGAVDVSFSLNGSWDAPMGLAFAGAKTTGDLLPALSLSYGAVVVVNCGHVPFRFAAPAGARCPAPSVSAAPDFELVIGAVKAKLAEKRTAGQGKMQAGGALGAGGKTGKKVIV